jgi:hypothetical protein
MNAEPACIEERSGPQPMVKKVEDRLNNLLLYINCFL